MIKVSNLGLEKWGLCRIRGGILYTENMVLCMSLSLQFCLEVSPVKSLALARPYYYFAMAVAGWLQRWRLNLIGGKLQMRILQVERQTVVSISEPRNV